MGKVLGPTHFHVATALQNLGTMCALQSRLAEAETLYRRALMIQEQTLGPEHPAVGRTLLSYGGSGAVDAKARSETANDRARRISAHARKNHRDSTVDAAQLGYVSRGN